MKLEIQVTKEHLRNGYPNNPISCPVALALKDAGFKAPHVGQGTVHYGARKVCALPPDVTKFMKKFDRDCLALPRDFFDSFSFTLEVEDSSG